MRQCLNTKLLLCLLLNRLSIDDPKMSKLVDSTLLSCARRRGADFPLHAPECHTVLGQSSMKLLTFYWTIFPLIWIIYVLQCIQFLKYCQTLHGNMCNNMSSKSRLHFCNPPPPPTPTQNKLDHPVFLRCIHPTSRMP